MSQRGSAGLKGADAGSAEPLQLVSLKLCGLKSQCVVKSHVWCLGVSAPGGPRRAVCSLNHTFEICRIVLGNPLQAKASVLMTTARVPAPNTDFIFALMPGLW